MISNKEKNFVSVVIYAHNAASKVANFMEYINLQLSISFEKYEIIIVNDFSKDDTIKCIKEYMHKNNCKSMISVINMSKYHGLELAMNAGTDLAIGDFVFEFDSMEIDYEKELFMSVYRKAVSGFDIVTAAPNKKVDIASRMFYYLYNLDMSTNVKIGRETFRVISRRAINKVNSISKSIPYRKALYTSCGLEYSVICYENKMVKAKHYDKFEKSNRFDLAIDSLIIFTNIVQKISLLLSVTFVAASLVIGIYTIIVYCTPNKPVEGWAPIMGFLALGFSGAFVMFTIVLKYLSVILNMIFIKQGYLIESIDKLVK